MNHAGLKDLVGILTGPTKGIGRAIALSLAEQGTHLCLVARNAEGLKRISNEVEHCGVKSLPIACDLVDPDVPAGIVDQTVAHFGQLDILINNAGIALNAPIERIDASALDSLMAVNARAPFLLCSHAVPHLRKSRRASIVNIASVAAHKGYLHEAAYAASKHALLGMTKVLAKELQPDNIRVHAVSPGGVDTPMIEQVRPEVDKSSLMAPSEIAEVVMFLLTQRGNAVIDEVRLRRQTSDPVF